MQRLFCAAFAALMLALASPAQAAFPDHVRAMIFNMLSTLSDMPGILKHERHHNDIVSVGFKRGDLYYLFVYLGSYKIHYPQGPKPLAEEGVESPQWDQPELRLIPQAERQLRIFVSSKGPIEKGYADAEYLLRDVGLSGRISFAEHLFPPRGWNPPPLSEEEEKKRKKLRREYSNHTCCRRESLEYDAYWQELYDKALENGLEFYEQYWKPARATRIPR